MIALSDFNKDRITEKASALTYFSLLSIVPVLAMAFGIAKGFGLENYLQEELGKFFSGQETVLKTSLEFASRMIENAKGGIIAGISFVFLIYAVLRLMYNIEISFNQIWNTRSRTWQRKLSDYLAIMIIGPVFVILSGSATALVTSQLNNLSEQFEVLSYLKPLISFGRYVLIWLFLALLYLIFPNTRVKLFPALAAGILAGTAYQLTQLAWLEVQVFLSSYNAIYGSFAAFPLFMIWLQLSWLIVLFGAEYAFATQHAITWHYDSKSMQMSGIHKRKVTILILRHIVKNFEMGSKPLTVSDLSAIVQIPYRFIKDICDELVEVGLLNKVANEEAEIYQPALDINRIDIHTVLRKVEYKGFNELKTNEDELYEEIESLMQTIDETIKQSPGNKLLKEL